jgi:hypothetical protein
MLEPERFAAGPPARPIKLFVSYDREHDADLYALLVEQASRTSGFAISARSASRSPTDYADDELRRAIQEADEVVAICGERSDGSGRMGAELRIAQEEGRPYFLLWGRRDVPCTKPASARPDDAMFSWTWEILQTQILTVLRAQPAGVDERKARTSPAGAGAGAD